MNKIARLITNDISEKKKSTLNIVFALLVVVINTCINFFLSPFITEHLGVEANGYITLANNFVSYFGLITTALNSMCGRFMLVAVRQNDHREANEYYTSVLFGDWILAAVLLVPALVLIIGFDSLIQVSSDMLTDVQILFALVFVNFFIGLCIPKWSNSTYTTNRLYLRSIKTAFTTIIRALLIYVAYKYLPPYAFYVALAGVVMTIANTIIEYNYKRLLLPDIHVIWNCFNWKKIKILVSSGIWNTISQCGNLLLEGLDILIANIFINPIMSGVLSLSKIIPNMINQIVGTVGTTFGPRLIELYADHDYSKLVQELKSHMKIVSTIANIPIGGALILGTQFFSLWVPSQDSKQLTVLMSLTLCGLLFSGVANCILNIFVAANKLKLNSLVVIVSGLVNIGVIVILIKTTNLGAYAVAGVNSVVTILRIFCFTAPYAAKCVNQRAGTFIIPLIKAGGNVMVPIGVGLLARMIPGSGWVIFMVRCLCVGAVTIIIDYYTVLNQKERKEFWEMIRHHCK